MKRILLALAMLFAFATVSYAALNLNTATVEQLQTLPGIGPVKAKAIAEDRKKNGPYKSVDDLKRVNGIGPKTIDAIRSSVTANVVGLSARRSLGSTPSKPATPPAKAMAPADANKKPAGK